MGELRNNAWMHPMAEPDPQTELEKAKEEMKAARRVGGFAYKQAKARYERLLRKEWMGRK